MVAFATCGRLAGGRGRRTADQFRDNIVAVDLRLTHKGMTRLNEVSKPPLIYPYWHQGQFAFDRFSAADRALHDGNPPPAW